MENSSILITESITCCYNNLCDSFTVSIGNVGISFIKKLLISWLWSVFCVASFKTYLHNILWTSETNHYFLSNFLCFLKWQFINCLCLLIINVNKNYYASLSFRFSLNELHNFCVCNSYSFTLRQCNVCFKTVAFVFE